MATKFLRFAAVSLLPGLSVAVFYIGKAAVETWLLGQCDPKFGCAGGVSMIATVTSVAGVLSFIGCALAAALYTSAVYQPSRLALLLAVAVTSLVLIVAFATVANWPGTELHMVFGWVILSGIASFVSLFGAAHIRLSPTSRHGLSNS